MNKLLLVRKYSKIRNRWKVFEKIFVEYGYDKTSKQIRNKACKLGKDERIDSSFFWSEEETKLLMNMLDDDVYLNEKNRWKLFSEEFAKHGFKRTNNQIKFKARDLKNRGNYRKINLKKKLEDASKDFDLFQNYDEYELF